MLHLYAPPHITHGIPYTIIFHYASLYPVSLYPVSGENSPWQDFVGEAGKGLPRGVLYVKVLYSHFSLIKI
jgi:hypothetical protein